MRVDRSRFFRTTLVLALLASTAVGQETQPQQKQSQTQQREPGQVPIPKPDALKPVLTISQADLGDRGDMIEQIAFSPDGKEIAFACSASLGGIGRGAEGGVSIWDIASKQKIASFAGEMDTDCSTVAFSPDGKYLAVGDCRGGVILWDRAAGRRAGTINSQPAKAEDDEGHAGAPAIGRVQFTPDSKRLIVLPSRDRKLPIWDVATRRPAESLAIPPDLVVGAPFFSHDGTARVVGYTVDSPEPAHVGDEPTRITLWDFSARKAIWSRDGFTPFHFAEVSADGRRISLLKMNWGTVGQPAKEVLLLDPSTGKTLVTYRSPQAITQVEPSPDGRFLAIGIESTEIDEKPGKPAELRLIDAETGRLVAHLEFDQASLPSNLTFSPNSRLIAIAGFDDQIKVWRIEEILARGQPAR